MIHCQQLVLDVWDVEKTTDIEAINIFADDLKILSAGIDPDENASAKIRDTRHHETVGGRGIKLRLMKPDTQPSPMDNLLPGKAQKRETPSIRMKQEKGMRLRNFIPFSCFIKIHQFCLKIWLHNFSFHSQSTPLIVIWAVVDERIWSDEMSLAGDIQATDVIKLIQVIGCRKMRLCMARIQHSLR